VTLMIPAQTYAMVTGATRTGPGFSSGSLGGLAVAALRARSMHFRDQRGAPYGSRSVTAVRDFSWAASRTRHQIAESAGTQYSVCSRHSGNGRVSSGASHAGSGGFSGALVCRTGSRRISPMRRLRFVMTWPKFRPPVDLYNVGPAIEVLIERREKLICMASP